MSKKDQFDEFLPESKQENLYIEIPAEQRPLEHNRIPSGYEPMGEIELRGRVFRGLASGQVHWWVLITGWIILGSYTLLVCYLAVTSFFWAGLIFLAIAVIPLLVLWKGTTAKLSRRKRRKR
ncbi:hypothetical protein ACE1B6_24820 [Aerosakkonemataceae cyanobacterium BLCC-F154]|uniref:Uncharacterized protein n=1 Tax=Floridaenema fluviatile BLCC-F154 TaxID=3153640 RepID=A0ABV4YI33_9CYAN